jgi:hypothetical protein
MVKWLKDELIYNRKFTLNNQYIFRNELTSIFLPHIPTAYNFFVQFKI